MSDLMGLAWLVSLILVCFFGYWIGFKHGVERVEADVSNWNRRGGQ